MEKSMNIVMAIITGAMIGWIGCIKYYNVQGLWGTQNAALHTERVVLPTIAKAAVEASKACERNAGTALDNDADRSDLTKCPSVPKLAAKVVPAAH